jgi:hypothetical protein
MKLIFLNQSKFIILKKVRLITNSSLKITIFNIKKTKSIKRIHLVIDLLRASIENYSFKKLLLTLTMFLS